MRTTKLNKKPAKPKIEMKSGETTDLKLFSVCDTRYADGVAELYANWLAIWHKEPATNFIDSTSEFVNTTAEWHEKHRHTFQPHPDWWKAKEHKCTK